MGFISGETEWSHKSVNTCIYHFGIYSTSSTTHCLVLFFAGSTLTNYGNLEEDTAIINQEEKTRAISALMYKITGIVQYYPAEQRIYNLIQRQGWPFRVYAGLD